MFAGCIDRMSRDGCSGCAPRDPCRDFLGKLFAPTAAQSRKRGPDEWSPPPFLALLGGIARAMEARARPRQFGFRREVERQVETMLESGAVRVDALARELGMSRQTLYRRLKAEGATFEALLDAVRRRSALKLIREGVSVKEAAYRLSFSDPSAFSRAYKRWTGRSPKGPRQSG